MNETAATWKPNAAHIALGAFTVLVLLFDVVLLFTYLIAIWRSAAPSFVEGFSVTVFLLTALVFGLGAGIGIVSRSFGFPSRLATERRPFFSIVARIGVFATVFLAAWFEWSGWGSSAYIVIYLFPSTTALFFLSVINLAWRRYDE